MENKDDDDDEISWVKRKLKIMANKSLDGITSVSTSSQQISHPAISGFIFINLRIHNLCMFMPENS
jgi:hypothetical protein